MVVSFGARMTGARIHQPWARRVGARPSVLTTTTDPRFAPAEGGRSGRMFR